MGIWELRFGIWGSGPATRDLGLRIWDLGFGTYTPLEQLTLLINWVWPTSLIFLTFIDHFGMKNISRSIPGLFWLSWTWAVLVLGVIIFHSWLKLSLKSLKSEKSEDWGEDFTESMLSEKTNSPLLRRGIFRKYTFRKFHRRYWGEDFTESMLSEKTNSPVLGRRFYRKCAFWKIFALIPARNLQKVCFLKNLRPNTGEEFTESLLFATPQLGSGPSQAVLSVLTMNYTIDLANFKSP